MDVEVYSYNPNTWEAEEGDIGQPGIHSKTLFISTKRNNCLKWKSQDLRIQKRRLWGRALLKPSLEPRGHHNRCLKNLRRAILLGQSYGPALPLLTPAARYCL